LRPPRLLARVRRQPGRRRCDQSEAFGDPLAQVIGWDNSGVLIHDGWSPADRFTAARPQQCLRHLLNRSRELLEAAVGGPVHFSVQ
jgi:hypothetical protein